jgi:hypothetical protein
VSAKTCGNCKHADIQPPRMSKHKTPQVLERFAGACAYLKPVLPMVSRGEGFRTAVWTTRDATECPCWEPKL